MTHRDDFDPRDPRDEMLDRRLDEVLHDLKDTYRVPRSAPPYDAMWAGIERELHDALPSSGGATVVPIRRSGGTPAPAHRRWAGRHAQWVGVAAALVVGVGLGRLSERPQVVVREVPVQVADGTDARRSEKPVPVKPKPSTDPERRVAEPGETEPRLARNVVGSSDGDMARAAIVAALTRDDDTSDAIPTSTNRYLGQTAAMLTALANDVPQPGDDARFARRARELLITTRLMMDAPATDEKSRALLEDLELVLTQVVRLRGDAGTQELKLIREALEQRELLPRLYSAAVEGGDD